MDVLRGQERRRLSPVARLLAVARAGTWLAYCLADDVRQQVLTNAVCGGLTRHRGEDSGVAVTTAALSMMAGQRWGAHGLARALPPPESPEPHGPPLLADRVGLPLHPTGCSSEEPRPSTPRT